MSFRVDTFVANPKLTELATLKRSDLVSLMSHYNLEVNSGIRKRNVRKLVCDYLLDENVVSDKEAGKSVESAVESKRLKFQEKEKECETQVRLKELEIKEHEIAV